MDPVALVAALVVVAAVALAGCAAAGWHLAVSSRRRRAGLAADLARSQAEVDALARKVDDLSAEVSRARRRAAEDREYVITSLGTEGTGDGAAGQPTGHTRDVAARRAEPLPAAAGAPSPPAGSRLGRALEDRLLAAVARRSGGPPVRQGVTDAAVRAASVAYGVRRALSPDVLDRVAAEAHVARRRSRRARRREIREARRLLRAVSTDRRPDQDVA